MIFGIITNNVLKSIYNFRIRTFFSFSHTHKAFDNHLMRSIFHLNNCFFDIICIFGHFIFRTFKSMAFSKNTIPPITAAIRRALDAAMALNKRGVNMFNSPRGSLFKERTHRTAWYDAYKMAGTEMVPTPPDTLIMGIKPSHYVALMR